MLVDQRFDLQTDQLIEPHIQNGIGLFLGKHQLRSHDLGFLGFKFDAVDSALDQAGLRHGSVLGTAQDLDDQVDHVAGLDQSFLYLFAFQLFCQQIRVFPRGHLILEPDILLQDLLKPHSLRPAIADGQHIDAESILQPGLLIKKILKILHVRIFA